MVPIMKNLIKGSNATLITESIFRDSKKYWVFPFGYETSFSGIIQQIDSKNNSDASLQIRSMPDLLVFDSDKKEVFLVECKYRNIPRLDNLQLKKSGIDKYKKYWKGCILVVIVPLGELLYAQNVDKLHIENKKVYGDNIYFNLNSEFEPFTNIFQKIDKRIINKYKTFITTISS